MGGSAGGGCSATSVGMVSGGALRRDRLPGGTATTPPPPCSAVLVRVLRRTVSAAAGLEELVFAMVLMTGIKPVCCSVCCAPSSKLTGI